MKLQLLLVILLSLSSCGFFGNKHSFFPGTTNKKMNIAGESISLNHGEWIFIRPMIYLNSLNYYSDPIDTLEIEGDTVDILQNRLFDKIKRHLSEIENMAFETLDLVKQQNFETKVYSQMKSALDKRRIQYLFSLKEKESLDYDLSLNFDAKNNLKYLFLMIVSMDHERLSFLDTFFYDEDDFPGVSSLPYTIFYLGVFDVKSDRLEYISFHRKKFRRPNEITNKMIRKILEPIW